MHKLVYSPLLGAGSNDGARDFARISAASRFTYLDAHLHGRAFLLARFTVADAYLVTVLNWSRAAGLDLSDWPAIQAYITAISVRPAVARALAEEVSLYQQQQARRQAA